jgi:acyl-CoA synthetase (AMP-forming)/AMP-acid ligase II
MGERVGVAIVPVDGSGRASPPTLDELRDHCRDRLAPYKLPEVLAIVDQLPHNELGKLPRRAVAELIGRVAGASRPPAG